MRGFVERMEMLSYSMPEGRDPTADEVMDSYLDDADAISEEDTE